LKFLRKMFPHLVKYKECFVDIESAVRKFGTNTLTGIYLVKVKGKVVIVL